MRFTYEQARLAHVTLLAHAMEIMGAKRKDYSGDIDPFANFRQSVIYGVEPWKGAGVRGLDKVMRLINIFNSEGQMAVNEKILDTAADRINYAIIEVLLAIETLPDEVAKPLIEELTRVDQ